MSYTPIAIKQNGVVVGYATKSMDIGGDSVTFSHDGKGHFVFNIDTSEFVSKLGSEFTGDLILTGGNIVVSENETIDEWTIVLERVKTHLGKKYDTLFDLTQDQRFSCISLIRNALMASPDYHKDFAHFEAMVQKAGNVDPNMLYDCPDFEIVWETRHK